MGLMARIKQGKQRETPQGDWQVTLDALDGTTTRTIAITSEWVKRAQAGKLPMKDYTNG